MPLVERVRGTRCTAEPVLILPSLPPLEEQTFPSSTIRHCWRWSSASRGSKSMILEVSDISVQEIRDSLTAVWEELLNKNNCKQAHHGKQRFLFHLGNYIYIFNWLECPQILKYSARALGEWQKNRREKNCMSCSQKYHGFHCYMWGYSWRARTSFPTRKIPERKNLRCKNSSPVNQETEILWCASLVPFPLLLPPFTLCKWVSTSFWAGKNLFPCSRDNFRGSLEVFPLPA